VRYHCAVYENNATTFEATGCGTSLTSARLVGRTLRVDSMEDRRFVHVASLTWSSLTRKQLNPTGSVQPGGGAASSSNAYRTSATFEQKGPKGFGRNVRKPQPFRLGSDHASRWIAGLGIGGSSGLVV
jgi:hypothetical protein